MKIYTSTKAMTEGVPTALHDRRGKEVGKQLQELGVKFKGMKNLNADEIMCHVDTSGVTQENLPQVLSILKAQAVTVEPDDAHLILSPADIGTPLHNAFRERLAKEPPDNLLPEEIQTVGRDLAWKSFGHVTYEQQAAAGVYDALKSPDPEEEKRAAMLAEIAAEEAAKQRAIEDEEFIRQQMHREGIASGEYDQ